MGKTATELPDALEPADGPEKAGNVDDLLAQMAGDEIDRLLSEADDPRGKRAEPPTPPPVELSPSEGAEGVARKLDELFSGSDMPGPSAADYSPIPSSSTALREPQGNSDPPGPALGIVDKSGPQDTDPDGLRVKIDETTVDGVVIRAEPDADDDAAIRGVADGTTEESAERAALDAPLEEEFGEDGIFDNDRERPLPIYLKPLALLSAPLDASPDWLRDLLGKLGLLTLFNAAAVLIYVFLFRRHH